MSFHKTAWRVPKITHGRSLTRRWIVWRCTGGCFLGVAGWRTSVQFRRHVVDGR